MGSGVASLRERVAWVFGVRFFRANRFLFALIVAAAFAIAMKPTDANAQFTCVAGPPVTCTNSGNEPADFFPGNPIFPFDVVFSNSGTAQNIAASTAAGGSSFVSNSGTALVLTANTVDTGNATVLNSGTAGHLEATTESGTATVTNTATGNASSIQSSATFGGNSVVNHSGFLANGIFNQTTAGGNATTNIFAGGFVGSDSDTRTFAGGNATTNNVGTITNLMRTGTQAGGDALGINSGIVGGTINTFATNGNATTINSGVSSDIGTAGNGGNATTINSGQTNSINTTTDISGTALTVNSGTVNGFINTITGVFNGGGDATTINTGTVFGDVYVRAADAGGFGNATFLNYGSVISGGNNGIEVSTTSGNAVFSNYGTIDLSNSGFPFVAIVSQDGNATGYNGGRIIGEVDVLAFNGGTATFSNAGFIDGRITGVAIDMFQNDPSAKSVLNIMPGSRIIGEIGLAGVPFFGFPGTTVNFFSGADISSITTFGITCGCNSQGGLIDSGSTVNVFGGAPYVINGNTVAILDPTSFALQDRNVVDVTRTISSLVSGRLTNPAPVSGGTTAIGFAPTGNVATDMARDAFAGISSLGYAAQDRVLFGNPSMTAPDGTSIWAQGFGGRRIQSAEAPNLRSVNNFYGGAMGVDKAVRPGLRVGGFIGAGTVKSTIDLNAGDTTSDMVFGGGYGRYTMSNSFVDFALLGGHSRNGVKRTIANNLAPGGLEYAAAKYDGWFISPEIAYGVQRTIAPKWTVTPMARVRYLAANFAGYQETGSTTNLTVASRTTHNFEERGEVTFAYTTQATPKERMQFSGKFGALALQRAGDSTVNTVLLGQSLAFATPGKNNVFGVYTGVGFDWRHSIGVSVFGGAEFTAMSDSSKTLTGRGGVRYAF